MRPVYTAAQMGAIDAAAGEPEEVLIERAGAAVARTAVQMLGGAYGRRVVVIAGKGNNGADGRVAARRLSGRGMRVRVVHAEGAPAMIADVDLVIDAAYGTGFRGTWAPPVVGRIPVLAVDIPSGVHADTGAVSGKVLRATRTVTFHALKPGLVMGAGADLAGEIEIADIGLPWAPTDVVLGDAAEVANVWPQRAADAHKWDRAVRVVAGSAEMPGAAILCSAAAQRAVAGMVQLCSPGGLVAGAHVEVVQAPLPETGWSEVALAGIDRFHALAVGPGLGRSTTTVAEVMALAKGAERPLLLDGDALYALGSAGPEGIEILRERSAGTVLTPHDGEFAMLAGEPPGDDRIGAASRLAGRTNATVVLKGPTTVVADPDGSATLVTHGDQRLATAGTGDVLAGIIAALLAAGCPPGRAAFLGAWVHASTLDHLPVSGVVASDLLGAIPAVLATLAAEPSATGGRKGHGPSRWVRARVRP